MPRFHRAAFVLALSTSLVAAGPALAKAKAAYTHNQTLIAPADEAINAIVADPATQAGALVAHRRYDYEF